MRRAIMSAVKRTSRKRPSTTEELAEYLTIKTMEHLAKMDPAERQARVAAFHRTVAEARAKHADARRTRGSRVRTPCRGSDAELFPLG